MQGAEFNKCVSFPGTLCWARRFSWNPKNSELFYQRIRKKLTKKLFFYSFDFVQYETKQNFGKTFGEVPENF